MPRLKTDAPKGAWSLAVEVDGRIELLDGYHEHVLRAIRPLPDGGLEVVFYDVEEFYRDRQNTRRRFQELAPRQILSWTKVQKGTMPTILAGGSLTPLGHKEVVIPFRPGKKD